MAKAKKKTLQELATLIHGLRANIAAAKEEYIAPLEAEEAKVTEEMLLALKEQGMKHVSYEGLGVFSRAYRAILKITDADAAMAWATEHRALKIDTAKAQKIIARELQTPAGFDLTETEYLSVRKGGKDDESRSPLPE